MIYVFSYLDIERGFEHMQNMRTAFSLDFFFGTCFTVKSTHNALFVVYLCTDSTNHVNIFLASNYFFFILNNGNTFIVGAESSSFCRE